MTLQANGVQHHKRRSDHKQTRLNVDDVGPDGFATNVNELNETGQDRKEVNYKRGDSDPTLGQSVGKSKMNLIYDKLDNFYSTFKLRKKTIVHQRWINEEPAKTCKIQRLQCVENKIRQFFWNFGGKLADYPILILFIPLFVCGLASIGVILKRQNLAFEAPFSLLYSQPVEEVKIRANFNYTNPKYNAFERFSRSQFAAILRTSPEDNILTDDSIEKYLRLKQKIEAVRVKDGEKLLKYDSICLRVTHESCSRDIIETIITMDKSLKLQYPETRVPLASRNSTINLYLADKLGGVVLDQDGNLNSAESLALYFKLAPKFERQFEEWDVEFRRLLKNENAKPLKLSWWSYGAFKQTFTDLLQLIFTRLGWSLLAMVGIAIVAFIKCDNHKSHPVLAVVSILVAVASITSSISVDIGINGTVNSAVLSSYFLIAATIVFVAINLLESWRKYSNSDIVTPKQKFRFILCWEMPGFVFICLFLFASYSLCSICTNLVLFQRVCHLLAANSIFMLILVLFLYCGLLYISGKRESAGVKWYQLWPPKNKSIQSHEYKVTDAENLHKSLLNAPSSGSCTTIEMLCSGYFRYISFLLFCIYIILAVWGCATADVSFNEKHYVRPNDNLYDFLTDYKRFYGGYSNYLELVFDGFVDYYNPKIRRVITDMLSWVESDLRASDKVVSWLYDFNEFEQSTVSLINRENFAAIVNLVFLRDTRYKTYMSDIQVSHKTDEILSSRMYVRLNDVGISRQAYIVKGLLAKAKALDLPLKIKSPSMFLVQHDVEIQWNTFSTFCVLLLLLFLFSLVTFAQPFLTIVLVLCVSSTCVGTLGYASLFGAPLNAFSVSTVLSGTMYTCFICMTFCYFYNNATEGGSKQRTMYAFQSTLRGIWWSAVATIVAFLPLLSVECDFVVHQLKIILCQLSATCLHCLLFLPPLLHFYSASLVVCVQSCAKCMNSGKNKPNVGKHVYFVPDTQKALLDSSYVQEFYKQKCQDFANPVTHALTYNREPPSSMIMPPPQITSVASPRMYRYFSNTMDKVDNVGRSMSMNVKKIEFSNVPNGWSPKPTENSLVPVSSDNSYDLLYESVPVETNHKDPKSKLTKKLSYSKVTKEVPLDGQRTSRVVAESYTIEADLPTKLERMLMQYDNRTPSALMVPSVGAPPVQRALSGNNQAMMFFGNPTTLKSFSKSKAGVSSEAPRRPPKPSQIASSSNRLAPAKCGPAKIPYTVNQLDWDQNRSLKFTMHKPQTMWH